MTAPRVPKDLTLAPVAVAIDTNLQSFRDLDQDSLIRALELRLDRPALGVAQAERRQRILDVALLKVDLHGWEARITDDDVRVRLQGGSVSLDIGLSATITEFIQTG